jgi:phosphatidylglycerol lysyltransferase
VNLADFNLEGKAYKHFRNAVNRLTRTGHIFTVHQPPIPSELLTELRNISDEWLTMMHGSEKRFSLGWFDDAYLRGCPIAVVCSGEGHIRAFTNLVSEYQLNELD